MEWSTREFILIRCGFVWEWLGSVGGCSGCSGWTGWSAQGDGRKEAGRWRDCQVYLVFRLFFWLFLAAWCSGSINFGVFSWELVELVEGWLQRIV